VVQCAADVTEPDHVIQQALNTGRPSIYQQAFIDCRLPDTYEMYVDGMAIQARKYRFCGPDEGHFADAISQPL
jgi:hypothetical protein